MITKTVCIAGGDQSYVNVKPCDQNQGFQILTLQQKCLLVQQRWLPQPVSMQDAWCHDHRGVQKESLSFPQKQVLKSSGVGWMQVVLLAQAVTESGAGMSKLGPDTH
ncbi:TPA: hypothetical protein ACH3X2_009086 [Trebouxia sp. C0005]